MLRTELAVHVDAILTQTRTGDDNLAHAMEDRLLGLFVDYRVCSCSVREGVHTSR